MAFQFNTKLQYVNLASNVLEHISWRVFHFLPLLNLVLRDNPLECSCEIHWLQQWVNIGRGDPDNQPMTCFSFGSEMPLKVLSMDNCTLPEVAILPSPTKTQEGGTLMFECHVSGTPTPEARWRTDMLHSRYEVEVGMLQHATAGCLLSHMSIKVQTK